MPCRVAFRVRLFQTDSASLRRCAIDGFSYLNAQIDRPVRPNRRTSTNARRWIKGTNRSRQKRMSAAAPENQIAISRISSGSFASAAFRSFPRSS